MKKVVFVCCVFAICGAIAQFDGLEEVTTKSSGDLKAIDKCGEGETKGKKICVSIYNCDPRTNTIRTSGEIDGYGRIDIRFGANSCDHYLEVCCNIPNETLSTSTEAFTSSPTAPTFPTPSPTPTPSTSGPVTPDAPDRSPSYCGIRNENGVAFQITGNTNNEAEYAEFPWMTAILKVSGGRVELVCGASLISPQVVLTAAHCVYRMNPQDLTVRVGDWDSQTVNEPLPHQDRAVEEIIVNEGFVAGNLYNDVALLVLSNYVAKAKNVGTICLPPKDAVIDSRNCFVSGWGKNTFGNEEQKAVILKKIELPVVQKNECQDALRNTRLGKFFELHRSFMCAGGQTNQDACTGDGGGPLVCPDPSNPTRYVQAGIVAWGIGCGDVNVPGVYADVAQFRDWIDEQMVRFNLPTTPYTQ